MCFVITSPWATERGSRHFFSRSMDGVMADAAVPAEAAPLQWRYVTIIYSCGCGVCAIFAVLDRVIEIEQVKGFWLIFALFPFCLVYSIYRQRLQASENSMSSAPAPFIVANM